MPIYRLADLDPKLRRRRSRTDSSESTGLLDDIYLSSEDHDPDHNPKAIKTDSEPEDLRLYGIRWAVISNTGAVFYLFFSAASYIGVGAGLYTAGYFIAAALGTAVLISNPISIACMFLALAIAMPLTHKTGLSKLCGKVGEALIQFPLVFVLGGFSKGIFFVKDWWQDTFPKRNSYAPLAQDSQHVALIPPPPQLASNYSDEELQIYRDINARTTAAMLNQFDAVRLDKTYKVHGTDPCLYEAASKPEKRDAHDLFLRKHSRPDSA